MKSLKSVKFLNYKIDDDDDDVTFELKNNGHTVSFTPKFKSGETDIPKVIYRRR